MRLFVLNCLLLASVAAALPNVRQKRDLSYIRNLITRAMSGGTQINIQPAPVTEEEYEYKLFKLPEFDDVMIKVTPKKPVVEEFVYPAPQPVNMNAFGKVVGTKSTGDTLVAVKGVNNLLSTGILYGGHNNVMKEVISPMFPTLNTANYVVEENVKTAPVVETRPVITEVVESKPVFTEVIDNRPAFSGIIENRPVFSEVIQNRPVYSEVIETRPVFSEVKQKQESRPVFSEVRETRPVFTEIRETRPVFTEIRETRPVFTEVRESRPVLTEVIRPLEETVEELKVPFEPKYSYKQMQNNEAVMTFTAHNNPAVEVTKTLKMKAELPMFIKNRVEEAIVMGADPKRFTPVQEAYQYQSKPVVEFSYPKVESNMQNSFREEVLTEGFETVADFGLSPQRLKTKVSPVFYNLRPTKTQAINPHPIPLHSHKSLHFEEYISATKDKANSQTKKVQAFTNLGDRVDLSQTLGPIPPQYIRHVSNKGENAAESNKKMVQQMEAVPIIGSKDSVSNAKIPNNVYKSQSNPNTGKVVEESNDLKTNVKTNPSHNVMAPAVTREVPKKDTVPAKTVVYTNKATTKPQSVPRPAAGGFADAVKLHLLTQNVQSSFKNNPIILEAVKDYSYHQKNADGSSLNVKGNKHGVAVDVKQDNNAGRGDIPD